MLANSHQKNETILTVKEVAEILKVSTLTIKKYIYQGKLRSFKTPGGHHRVLRSDLEAIIKKGKPYSEYLKFFHSLISNLEKRDTFTPGHSSRVANYSLLISKKFNLPQERLKNIRFAAIFHDIGKIYIDESILKKSGKLSKSEFSIIKSHSLVGERMIEIINEFKDIKPFIRHHHERYDGSGYPDRKALGDIPLEARIISVAESYDSMTSDSSYRKKLSKKEAIEELRREKGKQFDPQIVEVFLKVLSPNES